MTASLDAHDAWLARLPGGARLDLTGRPVPGLDFRGRDLSWAVFRGAAMAGCRLDWCDLRCCDFRGADLSTATFSRSILAGSAFAGCRPNWSSPELAGELLAREAATPARQALAARVADGIRGPWPDLSGEPEGPWARSVLARYGWRG